jgi:hypothetical protein
MAFEEMLHILQQRFAVDTISDIVQKHFTGSAKEVGRHLPRRQAAARKWTEQLERGRFTVYMEMDDTTTQRVEHLERGIERMGTRLTLALTLVGLLPGTALIGLIYPRHGWTEVIVGAVGVLALALVLYLAWLLWQQRP